MSGAEVFLSQAEQSDEDIDEIVNDELLQQLGKQHPERLSPRCDNYFWLNENGKWTKCKLVTEF